MTRILLPWAAIFLRASSLPWSQTLPVSSTRAAPLCLSITAFSSGDSDSNLALFISTAIGVWVKPGWLGWPSMWYLVTSSILVAGSTSHGAIAPSITPLLTDSVTWAIGMLTGVPPRAVRNSEEKREGLRSLMPLKPSTVRIGLLAVLITTLEALKMASTLKSLKSSWAFFWSYS